ncbi:regulatory protein GemA [Geobacter benzoatilyticus]|uniref:Regulatory protein GemA n=1 Tax=Geobacter benzoatilyticus TaxID=2815309 RepID=A0ABX7Q0I5_9BACT|nr:regulatory protein GemA [Geobacter benzoatilyticus]QSV44908.1 regulatory protein GemA [Geobacter benzoatilyticus]
MASKAVRDGRQPITRGQISAIHTLKTRLGMDEESYRALLQEFGGVESSKELSWFQADELIDEMKRKAGQKPQVNHKGKRHRSLEGRAGMATPAQLRKIEAVWAEVSRVEDPEERAKALRSFVGKIAQVSDLRFLDRRGVAKVIAALTAMQKRRGLA